MPRAVPGREMHGQQHGLGLLLFVGEGAVGQAAWLPGESGPRPSITFRINTLPKTGNKHTFTQGLSSQEGTRGTPCPRAGNSEEGQGPAHQPRPLCILQRHEAPPLWRVPPPRTGQQSWPRVQGRGEGPAGLGAGRLAVFKTGICQASWDLSEGGEGK